MPPIEIELSKPWLVQETDEWCSDGQSGNLLVAPQHELTIYLSEVSVHVLICIHDDNAPRSVFVGLPQTKLKRCNMERDKDGNVILSRGDGFKMVCITSL